jgi:hypothetical protein
MQRTTGGSRAYDGRFGDPHSRSKSDVAVRRSKGTQAARPQTKHFHNPSTYSNVS